MSQAQYTEDRYGRTDEPAFAGSRHPGRSVPQLLGDLVSQVSSLVRKEVQLARAEVGESVSTAGSSIAMIAAGGLLMLAALMVFLQALIAWLVEQQGWSAAGASLLVGLVVAGLGLILLLVGRSRLSAANLAPRRTAEQLQRDAAVAREQVR
jgi:uncharacterized membrane protein YqjE